MFICNFYFLSVVFNLNLDSEQSSHICIKSLNLRNKGVKIISCPSCARQGFKVIDTVKILEEKLSHIKTPITLSIFAVATPFTVDIFVDATPETV